MITRMQVEMAKSLYDQAHRAAEFAHAGWLLRQNFYHFWFPLATNEEFEKLMAVHNEHYHQAIEAMKQMREAYEKLSTQLDESDTKTK